MGGEAGAGVHGAEGCVSGQRVGGRTEEGSEPAAPGMWGNAFYPEHEADGPCCRTFSCNSFRAFPGLCASPDTQHQKQTSPARLAWWLRG